MMEGADIIKLKKTCTIFLSAFNLMYVNYKQFNPPFFRSEFPIYIESDFTI